MDTKTGIVIAGSFILGAAISGVTTYFITKKECDKRTQVAIDEMKNAHKKELDDIKGAKKEDVKEEKKEESKDVRIDKPDISEMSSIIHRTDNNDSGRTHYSVSAVKENIRNIVEQSEPEEKKEKEKEQTVVDYNTYIQLSDSDYFEKNFTFDTDTESWKDWDSDAEYDPTDLPFDPDNIIWDDNEQCYIADRGNKSIYVLEKV